MILKGKTLKGKNRIRELGEEWLCIRTSDTVHFSNRNGPWGFVKPAKEGVENQERWIHLVDDQDFEIMRK